MARATVAWGSDATRQVDRAGSVRASLDELFVAGVPLGSIEAVAHRVVHGGDRYVEPAIVDDALVEAITQLAELAPLHNTVAAETIVAARDVLPDPPHVAVFDTAFHATLSEPARRA